MSLPLRSNFIQHSLTLYPQKSRWEWGEPNFIIEVIGGEICRLTIYSITLQVADSPNGLGRVANEFGPALRFQR